MKEATRQRQEAEQKARLEAAIKAVVDSAPPLTPEQRDRLALLLRPSVPLPNDVEVLGDGSALDEMLGGK